MSIFNYKTEKYNKDKTWFKAIELKWVDVLGIDQFLIQSEAEKKAR